MTELQFAALSISLSTLGQSDISGVDREMLRTLAFLLEQALKNVQAALRPPSPIPPDAEQPEPDEDDLGYGWRHSGE